MYKMLCIMVANSEMQSNPIQRRARQPFWQVRTLVVLVFICSVCPALHAQNLEQFSTLAGQVANAVTMTHEVRILLAPLQGCLLDPSLCEELDTELRGIIRIQIPKAELAGPKEMLPVVRSAGLLQVDAYNEWVLQRLVERTPSRILITEDLVWKPDGYEVKSQVTDARKHKGLGVFGANVSFAEPNPDKNPVIFKDPDSGVALVVEKQFPDRKGFIKLPAGAPNRRPHPACVECTIPPLPPSSPPIPSQGDLVMLYNVTETGAVEHIDAVQAQDQGMKAAMVKAMQRWQFTPAVGDDGKPFATRELLDIPFTITVFR